MLLIAVTADLEAHDTAPRVIWNPSASAPIGFWRIDPHAAVDVGDMVLVRPPLPVRRLAAERRYLPMNVPLLKRIAAANGDKVCTLGATLYINERAAATRLAADWKGRSLPWWRGCRRLGRDEVLLLNDATESFDGRYFGPLPTTVVIGEATPLWLR
ncbi:S26 family signal peptidase [Hephaestia sp. GCM10023244]|uniref:S26 family signal peptidase n=1 Tax=unclassified Hephaestia TaxID=2631281 RepID=UPI002076D5D7|nr:S26 family signal peptidase [Hephaestia sp. MAHUQ-44]MCM8731982.1 S26 family signal peptidase [Hephaestia sp. MAHUQ-44]